MSIDERRKWDKALSWLQRKELKGGKITYFQELSPKSEIALLNSISWAEKGGYDGPLPTDRELTDPERSIFEAAIFMGRSEATLCPSARTRRIGARSRQKRLPTKREQPRPIRRRRSMRGRGCASQERGQSQIRPLQASRQGRASSAQAVAKSGAGAHRGYRTFGRGRSASPVAPRRASSSSAPASLRALPVPPSVGAVGILPARRGQLALLIAGVAVFAPAAVTATCVLLLGSSTAVVDEQIKIVWSPSSAAGFISAVVLACADAWFYQCELGRQFFLGRLFRADGQLDADFVGVEQLELHVAQAALNGSAMSFKFRSRPELVAIIAELHKGSARVVGSST
jgi:hypothetical protein